MLENAKHEAFAQAVATGDTAIGAYRQVYRGNPNTAKKAAYYIKRRPEVKARIMELRQQIHKANITGPERRHTLARLIRDGSEDSAAQVANKIKALELDARFAGELQPKPEEVKPASTPLETALKRLIFGDQGKTDASSKNKKTSRPSP